MLWHKQSNIFILKLNFWVGPVVAEGFYYDVDLGDEVISDEAIQ